MAGKKNGAAPAGNRMPDHMKKALDNSLGNELSGVRVHSDAAAQNATSSIGARAYAHGADVMFGSGRYQPSDHYGKSLIGHELTHTVQQAQGRVKPGVQN